jgi:hypothetical protein
LREILSQQKALLVEPIAAGESKGAFILFHFPKQIFQGVYRKMDE